MLHEQLACPAIVLQVYKMRHFKLLCSSRKASFYVILANLQEKWEHALIKKISNGVNVLYVLYIIYNMIYFTGHVAMHLIKVCVHAAARTLQSQLLSAGSVKSVCCIG